jgi:hypothetical protein
VPWNWRDRASRGPESSGFLLADQCLSAVRFALPITRCPDHVDHPIFLSLPSIGHPNGPHSRALFAWMGRDWRGFARLHPRPSQIGVDFSNFPSVGVGLLIANYQRPIHPMGHSPLRLFIRYLFASCQVKSVDCSVKKQELVRELQATVQGWSRACPERESNAKKSNGHLCLR